MKTKTVTIHNWDGSKYDVKAPVEAKYLGILSHTGFIKFYRGRPTLQAWGYYTPSPLYMGDAVGVLDVCPDKNLPFHDGFGIESRKSELLLKIEEV